MTLDRQSIDELRIDRTKVRSGLPGWLPWVVLALVGLAALVWWLKRPGLPVVTTAPVRETASGGSAAVLNASGYITARRAATVSSKVTGKVTAVLVEEGMKVEQGQLMARLDPAVADQSLQLSRAQAQAAASALEETKVRIEQARVDERRARNLLAQKVASQADLDKARADLRALEARLIVQRDQYTVAQREIRLRETDRSDTEIRAPFAGIVISKNAQAGEMISPNSAGGGFTRTGIATVVDMSSLEIDVDVNESYINRVRPDQKVDAILDAYPDWKIPAHVITVVPTADREKATVRVRIAIDQHDPRILPDMGVKVAFIAPPEEGQHATAMVVPRTALRRDGDKDIVLIVVDGKLERRAVSVGGSEGDEAKILSGVSAGETVVVTGPETLKDGQRVRVQEKAS